MVNLKCPKCGNKDKFEVVMPALGKIYGGYLVNLVSLQTWLNKDDSVTCNECEYEDLAAVFMEDKDE